MSENRRHFGVAEAQQNTAQIIDYGQNHLLINKERLIAWRNVKVASRRFSIRSAVAEVIFPSRLQSLKGALSFQHFPVPSLSLLRFLFFTKIFSFSGSVEQFLSTLSSYFPMDQQTGLSFR